MKVLVTGGAGFIGSNIVQEGLKRGHSITVFDNLSTGYLRNLEGLAIDFIEGDIRDAEHLLKVTSGHQAVFHLAASVGNIKSIENPIEDFQINYNGTLNVLNAAVKAKINSFIYSSSAAGYGEPETLPINEDQLLHPDSPYGISKIAGEMLAFYYQKYYNMGVTSLRYFNAYGVNQRFDKYGNVIPIFFQQLAINKPLTVYGDGNQTRDFINVKDIAIANWDVYEKKINGYYNIATGHGATVNQLINILESLTNKKLEINFQPQRPGDVIHSYANINKAINQFNFSPAVPLSQGIKEYFDWFNSNLQ